MNLQSHDFFLLVHHHGKELDHLQADALILLLLLLWRQFDTWFANNFLHFLNLFDFLSLSIFRRFLNSIVLSRLSLCTWSFAIALGVLNSMVLALDLEASLPLLLFLHLVVLLVGFWVLVTFVLRIWLFYFFISRRRAWSLSFLLVVLHRWWQEIVG